MGLNCHGKMSEECHALFSGGCIQDGMNTNTTISQAGRLKGQAGTCVKVFYPFPGRQNKDILNCLFHTTYLKCLAYSLM